MIFGIMDKDELVGFISGLIIKLFIEDKTIKATEVNFLCVKK